MFLIYDDIIKDLQSSGGITVYWDNLKRHIDSSIKTESYNGNNSKKDRKYPLMIHRYLDFKNQLKVPHLFHSSYYRISKNPNSKNVVTVHDFVYEFFSSGLKKQIHVLQKKNAILNADRIICVSENTKKDLLKFYPQIDEKIIKVIYHGVSKDFYRNKSNKPISLKNQNKKNLIFIGKRDGYKNFQSLIDFLSEKNEYNLILVGGGSLSTQEKKELKQIRHDHYQNVSNAKLNSLYNNSFALIYPSLYEGFGLPIIESLKAGCPVICNDGSSTKEIGDHFVLKGKITVDFIKSSLKKLEVKAFRDKLIQKGEKYASNFTWEKTVKETLDLYEQLWKEFQ